MNELWRDYFGSGIYKNRKIRVHTHKNGGSPGAIYFQFTEDTTKDDTMEQLSLNREQIKNLRDFLSQELETMERRKNYHDRRGNSSVSF